MTIPKMTDAQRLACTKTAVLFLMKECGEAFEMVNLESSAEFLKPVLREMAGEGLLEADPEGNRWNLTDKGETLLKKAENVMDRVMPFEVLSAVDLDTELPEDDADQDNPGQVYPDCYDPRFLPPSEDSDTAFDLRLAMITYITGYKLAGEGDMAGKAIDPYQVVFLQKLAKGQLNVNSDTFWGAAATGLAYQDIEEIVQTATTWQSMGDDDEDAAGIMDSLYTAAMAENRKRNGNECSACGAPLGLCEWLAKEEGDPLDECPKCEASYVPPEPEVTVYTCPNCNADIPEHARACPGCHAEIDGYGAGTVTEVTEEHTETVIEEDEFFVGFGYDPFYDPYYYDPYDPYVDALAFAIVCDCIW